MPTSIKVIVTKDVVFNEFLGHNWSENFILSHDISIV